MILTILHSDSNTYIYARRRSMNWLRSSACLVEQINYQSELIESVWFLLKVIGISRRVQRQRYVIDVGENLSWAAHMTARKNYLVNNVTYVGT